MLTIRSVQTIHATTWSSEVIYNHVKRYRLRTMTLSAFTTSSFFTGNRLLSRNVSTCGRTINLRTAQVVRMTAAPESAVSQTPKVSPVPTSSENSADSSVLPLTLENVEMVLDEMRPYLMADGGNVSVADIDGATVKLQLEGACGSCPSSTMTMKMGLERRLLERIPEIENVIQVEPEGPELNAEGIEKTLDEVRPFLNVAGGSIELVDLNVDSVAPTAKLKMTGSGAAINSVKVEITHRLKRNYPTLANVMFI